MTKIKRPNVRERLMSELILLGGEIMTRAQAVTMLQREDAHPKAIDILVFGRHATPLTNDQVKEIARNELMFTINLQVLRLGGTL